MRRFGQLDSPAGHLFDNVAADEQPQPVAGRLGREIGLENLFAVLDGVLAQKTKDEMNKTLLEINDNVPFTFDGFA